MFAFKKTVSFAFRRNEPKAESQPLKEPVHLPLQVEDRDLDNAIDAMLERFPRTLENLAA